MGLQANPNEDSRGTLTGRGVRVERERRPNADDILAGHKFCLTYHLLAGTSKLALPMALTILLLVQGVMLVLFDLGPTFLSISSVISAMFISFS